MITRFSKSHILIGAMFFCSFAYELLIIRCLGDKAVNALILPSLIVGVYIWGLGVGAAISNLFGLYRSTSLFLMSESALALIGGLGPILIRLNYIHFNQVSNWPSTLFPLILTFIISALSGFELPFFEKATRKEEEASRWHLMIGYSYIGCFAASLIVPFFLLPSLGPTVGALLIGALNLGLAALLCARLPTLRRAYAPVIASLLILIGLRIIAPQVDSFLTQATYSRVAMDTVSISDFKNVYRMIHRSTHVDRIESTIQTIDIVSSPIGPEEFALFLNERPQFHSRSEYLYHEAMAHVPHLALKTEPQRVLILGGGDGYLARELLKLPSVTRIDLVEIDPQMIELARNHPKFLRGNHHSFSSPKVFVHVDDAYRWIRQNHEQFDAVYIDFPFPLQLDLSRLFSREFYHRVLNILTPTGYACFDFPVRQSNMLHVAVTPLDEIRSTLEAAGAKSLWAFGSDDGFIVFQRQEQSYDFALAQSSPLLRERTRERIENLSPLLNGSLSHHSFVNSIFRPTIFGPIGGHP